MAFKNFLSKAKDIDILASLPDGVMLIDGAGKIEWINKSSSTLLNLSKNEIFKHDINGIIESGLDLIKQAALSNKSVVGRVIHKDVKDFYAEITAGSVDDYFVVIFRDVTQNYKIVTSILAEHENSRKINKDKNNFLVKLSNEIKSPIHSVIGFSQAMMDGLGGEISNKQEKYIKIINKNSNDVLHLIDKILELAKAESNLFDYEFQVFDAVNAVHSVLKNYETAINDKKLTLVFDAENLVKKTIFSDEKIFKTILQNILESSINLTDIGSINVKLSHPDPEFVSQCEIDLPENVNEHSYLMVTVSDTGAGIAENDLNVIFEPYAQLDRPNKKNIVRSIALASVKHFVKFLKGVVWMESEPMQGSIYSFIIPVEKG